MTARVSTALSVAVPVRVACALVALGGGRHGRRGGGGERLLRLRYRDKRARDGDGGAALPACCATFSICDGLACRPCV